MSEELKSWVKDIEEDVLSRQKVTAWSRSYISTSAGLRLVAEVKKLLEENEKLKQRVTDLTDDPIFDGTDAGHPAWWRGNDAGVAITVNIVNGILDGKDTGGTYGYKPLEELRQRLLKLKKSDNSSNS